MNKYLLKLLMASLLISLSACEFEMSDNGDLDGFWQLYSVDTLETGHSADMRHNGIYWGIQMHLLSIETKKPFTRFLFRFNHEGNTLHLYDPRFDSSLGVDQRIDEAVTHEEDLKMLGLFSLDETLQIETLNSSRMILRNDSLRLFLRKY